MTVSRTIAASIVLAGLALPTASLAAPHVFVARLMRTPLKPGKTFACFERVYDAPHLAAHAEQKVRAAEMLVVAYSSLDYAYQLRIGLQFRGRPKWLSTVAECGSGPSLSTHTAVCAGPGEGTSSRLTLARDGSLLMRIPAGAHLWKPGPPDPTHTVDDAFGSDDKLFHLDRVALSHCADQALDDDERTLLARGR